MGILATNNGVVIAPNNKAIFYGDRLPNEYQRVEYISTPTSVSEQNFAYINTGINSNISHNHILKTVIDFQCLTLWGDRWFFGGANGDAAQNYVCGSFSGLCVSVNGRFNTDVPIDTNRHTIIINGEKNGIIGTFVDNTNYYSEVLYNTAGNGNVLYLMASNHDVGGHPSNFQMPNITYACQMYIDGILVRDYQPVRRKSDNMYGMYEYVNCEFKPSDGTAPFSGGADVN